MASPWRRHLAALAHVACFFDLWVDVGVAGLQRSLHLVSGRPSSIVPEPSAASRLKPQTFSFKPSVPRRVFDVSDDTGDLMDKAIVVKGQQL
jgi:hypothetical protein